MTDNAAITTCVIAVCALLGFGFESCRRADASGDAVKVTRERNEQTNRQEKLKTCVTAGGDWIADNCILRRP